MRSALIAIACVGLLVAGGVGVVADSPSPPEESAPPHGPYTMLRFRIDPESPRVLPGETVLVTAYVANPGDAPVSVRASLHEDSGALVVAVDEGPHAVPANGETAIAMRIGALPDAPHRMHRLDLRVAQDESGWYQQTSFLVTVGEPCCRMPPRPLPVMIEAPASFAVGTRDVARYEVRVRNFGDAPVDLRLSAQERAGGLPTWVSAEHLHLAPGETRAVHVEADATFAAPGEYAIVVEAAGADGRAEATTQLSVVRAEPGPGPCCPPWREPPCCQPTWGHATPTGYRLHVPLSEGAFTLPLFVHGRVEGQTLVLDVEFANGGSHRAR